MKKLTGKIIVPKNNNYDELRRDLNLNYNYYPKYIVYPRDIKDIINAVNYGRENKLNIRIRNGGHNYEAFSVANDAIVIDVSELLSFSLDKDSNTVTIGSGFRLGELYERLAKEGYAFVGGSCKTVGVTGLTLGGGVGYLQRLYGLSCDNLIEIQLVDVYGNIIVSNNKEHSDLFKALRGAGGNNFGVVTSLKFKIYPIGNVISICVKWSREKRYEIIKEVQKNSENLDKRLTIKLVVTYKDITVDGLGIMTLDEVFENLKSLLSIDEKKEFDIKEMSFIEFVIKNGGDYSKPIPFKTTGRFIYNPLSYEACNLIFDYLDRIHIKSNNISVGLLLMGGQIKENKKMDNGFNHSNALFIFQIETKWEESEKSYGEEIIEWVNSFNSHMDGYFKGGYVNYCDSNIENYLDYYYGDKFLLLKRIKEKYNPTDIFKFPQSL